VACGYAIFESLFAGAATFEQSGLRAAMAQLNHVAPLLSPLAAVVLEAGVLLASAGGLSLTCAARTPRGRAISAPRPRSSGSRAARPSSDADAG
jgi:hypothetical protein